jgi:hypothetical protein
MIDTPFRTVRRDPGGATRVPEAARLDAPGAWSSRYAATSRPASRSSERARTAIAWKNALSYASLTGGRPSGECRFRAQPEKSCAISAGCDSIRLRDWMEPPMAWTETARREHARRCCRYSSDLTDREWGLIAPLLPGPRRLGRPRTTDLHDVVNAIQYIAATGCQWSLLPRDFPPFTTVQRYFYGRRDGGLLWAINHLMVNAA